MPGSVSNFSFVFIAFRPFATDFRRYLIQALQSLGYPCTHLYLGRGAMEARSGADFAAVTRLDSVSDAARHLRGFVGGKTGIVVNSTGNSGPDVVLRLWAKLRDFVWIYDVYDWLLYDAVGLKRLQWWATDRAYRAIAQSSCVRSRDLQAFYPKSFFSDNASHMAPRGGARAFDNKIVVTASFDRRTDFALLQALAERERDWAIDLYGSVYDNDPPTLRAIARLTSDHANIRYHGRFEFTQLPEILGNYAIGLAPYRLNEGMTRYISPDKLFHYLCAGIEVVTTPGPGAASLEPYLYVAASAADVGAAIRRIAEAGERRNPRTLHERFNWQIRAHEFCESVRQVIARETRAAGLSGESVINR
jgi:hypothetical protein